MSDKIIKVENLSKRYRIGFQEKKADTFAQQLWNNLQAPVKNFKRIRGLGKFQVEEDTIHWALKDVSFEVKQGEVLGIIGKNGAGKSTLLKILSKITEPTSGRIEMNGRAAALLEVGTGFHPELTGRENIFMNGTILGMTKREIDRKLDEIIDFSGVEKYIDTPVKFYSSGMRVRLGFSVAAHLEPEILIVDEVLAVGDFEFQKKCLGKMEDVSKKDGRTVLFVSHNMTSILGLCYSGLLLKDGRIQEKGKIKDTVETYIKKNDGIIESVDNRIDRLGLGNSRINSVEITTNILLVCSEFEVKIEYSSKNSLIIKEFGISIWDLYENKLVSISSNLKNEVNNFDNSGMIFCKIPNLPLVRGNYFLNVFISSIFGVEDYIEKVIQFEVQEADVFGTGNMVNPDWGKIVVNHTWYKNDTI